MLKFAAWELRTSFHLFRDWSAVLLRLPISTPWGLRRTSTQVVYLLRRSTLGKVRTASLGTKLLTLFSTFGQTLNSLADKYYWRRLIILRYWDYNTVPATVNLLLSELGKRFRYKCKLLKPKWRQWEWEWVKMTPKWDEIIIREVSGLCVVCRYSQWSMANLGAGLFCACDCGWWNHEDFRSRFLGDRGVRNCAIEKPHALGLVSNIKHPVRWFGLN